MIKNPISVLEITDTCIKLAQLKEKKLFLLAVKDLLLKTDDAIIKAVRDLIVDIKVKPTNLIVAIPRNLITLRVLKLPSREKTEIDKMIELQATKQLPYAKEDIITDYLIIERNISGYSKVLLALARRDVIDRFLKIIQDAGLDPISLTISSQGICSWYQLYKNKAVNQPVILLDIDASNLEICFFFKDNLLFSRSILLDIKELDKRIDYFIEQMRLTISTYAKEDIGESISKVVITGIIKDAKLPSRIKEEFGLPVEIIDALTGIHKDRSLILPLKVKEQEVSITAILGLALSKDLSGLNLLPQDIRQKQKMKVIKKEFIYTAILLVLALILGAVSLASNIYKKRLILSKLETSLSEIAPQAKRVDEAMRKLILIKKRLDSEGTSIDILYELYKIVPSEITLRVFNLDENNNLTLQGSSSSMPGIFNFVSAMEQTGYFKNVQVKYASKRKIRDKQINDFQIICQVVK